MRGEKTHDKLLHTHALRNAICLADIEFLDSMGI
jgi:hypothetical protein